MGLLLWVAVMRLVYVAECGLPARRRRTTTTTTRVMMMGDVRRALRPVAARSLGHIFAAWSVAFAALPVYGVYDVDVAPAEVVGDVAAAMEREFYDEGTVRSEAWKAARRAALEAAMEAGDGDASSVRIIVQDLIAMTGDPYTRYVPPEAYAALNGAFTRGERPAATMGSLGLRIGGDAAPTTVVEVLQGSPAAGLVRAGDALVAVGGARVDDGPISAAQVVAMLRGEAGSTVDLQFRCAGKVSLTRKVLPTPREVEVVDVRADVATVALRSFSRETPRQLEAAIADAARRGATTIVLDCRGNGGGALDGGVQAAGLFLPPRTLVATLRSREDTGGRPRAFLAENEQFGPQETTVYILADEMTASAAELFTAALHDANRARLLGRTTYGKARVQRAVELPGGGALLVSRQTYSTPKGRDLTGVGIRPDVALGEDECGPADAALACFDAALSHKRPR